MPEITFKDLSLKEYNLTKRTKDLKDVYFKAMPEICVERPHLITQYSLREGFFKRPKISILDKGRLYRYALTNRNPIVWNNKSYKNGMIPFEFNDNSLFAGSTTTKFKGVPLYPEFLALALWPELWTISKRTNNPFYISEDEAKELNYNIFPYWMENNISELARKRVFDENLAKLGMNKHAPEMKLLERLVFFLASKPNCISHTILDFSRAINKGLRAVINDADDKGSKTSDVSQKEFYKAISEVLEGIITYSRNLANKATEMAATETDGVRRNELLKIYEVNSHVPEFPARTFREGLTTIWICWIACHLENPNVGLSLGRLDQVLYDLYRHDIDNNVMTIDQAKVVFEEKSLSFKDMIAAIENDFKGCEVLQKRLMNPDKTPKYGNDDVTADENVIWLIKLLDKAFGEKENYRGGRYRVGYWTMTNHAGFGRLMGALPSGRKARENFTSGITPVSSVTPVLTKTLNSVAKQPAECVANGAAFNLKYTPETSTPEKLDRMLNNFASTVEGCFDYAGTGTGAMEIQFNITTHDTFVDAVKNPDKYPELLVRVSGYTAYFKDLNPQMQKEIIDRTEYLLSNGKYVYYEPFPLRK